VPDPLCDGKPLTICREPFFDEGFANCFEKLEILEILCCSNFDSHAKVPIERLEAQFVAQIKNLKDQQAVLQRSVEKSERKRLAEVETLDKLTGFFESIPQQFEALKRGVAELSKAVPPNIHLKINEMLKENLSPFYELRMRLAAILSEKRKVDGDEISELIREFVSLIQPVRKVLDELLRVMVQGSSKHADLSIAFPQLGDWQRIVSSVQIEISTTENKFKQLLPFETAEESERVRL